MLQAQSYRAEARLRPTSLCTPATVTETLPPRPCHKSGTHYRLTHLRGAPCYYFKHFFLFYSIQLSSPSLTRAAQKLPSSDHEHPAMLAGERTQRVTAAAPSPRVPPRDFTLTAQTPGTNDPPAPLPAVPLRMPPSAARSIPRYLRPRRGCLCRQISTERSLSRWGNPARSPRALISPGRKGTTAPMPLRRQSPLSHAADPVGGKG